MNHIPTAKDLIPLPGPYNFKIIVRPELMDTAQLLQLTRMELARQPADVTLQTTPSRHGKYISYTLTVHIERYEEIEGLYRAFREHEATVYIL